MTEGHTLWVITRPHHIELLRVPDDPQCTGRTRTGRRCRNYVGVDQADPLPLSVAQIGDQVALVRVSSAEEATELLTQRCALHPDSTTPAVAEPIWFRVRTIQDVPTDAIVPDPQPIRGRIRIRELPYPLRIRFVLDHGDLRTLDDQY